MGKAADPKTGGPRYPAIPTHNSSLSLGVCQETGSPGHEIKVGCWDSAGFLRLALRSGYDNRNGSRPAERDTVASAEKV